MNSSQSRRPPRLRASTSFDPFPTRSVHQDKGIPSQATAPIARVFMRGSQYDDAACNGSSLGANGLRRQAAEPPVSSQTTGAMGHSFSCPYEDLAMTGAESPCFNMVFKRFGDVVQHIMRTHSLRYPDSYADGVHRFQHLLKPSAKSASQSNVIARGVKYYEVLGTLNGVNVNAIPDSGSGMDAVSDNFVKRHFPDFKPNGTTSIRLPGGHHARSIGRIIGDFKFDGEERVYRREFHVLRNSTYDLVLGKVFLNLTETLTKHCHRIIEKIRTGLRVGGRLFLLGEPSRDGLPCSVNGAEAWALPDTGSDVMAVSASFARRHNFHVHREEVYRNPLRLIDGSTIRTDGMVFDADLQFDLTQTMFSKNSPSFICDIHVIDDLPCDIVLSNEFIFQNQIYSRFAGLFCPASSETSGLERSILFLALERKAISWKRVKGALSRSRGSSSAQEDAGTALNSQSPQQGPHNSWDERLRLEGKRRIAARNVISRLSGDELSRYSIREQEIQVEWERDNPRPEPGGSSSGIAASGEG